MLEQEVQRLFGQEQEETEAGTEAGAETEEQDTGLGQDAAPLDPGQVVRAIQHMNMLSSFA